MAAHLTENVVKHVSLQAKGYKQLKEENKQLKQQVAKLTEDLKLQQICTPICPVELTITDYEQYRRHGEKWNSPSFYTHLKGYKMKIIIVANGNSIYEGTHTAIGVCLLKGEFDEQLQWPFQGTVTIKLLSQENEKHKTIKLSFTETMPNIISSRVLTEEEQQGKFGPYVPHTGLQPKYLKNDCLKVHAYQYKM